jgi:3-deoxy-D-manno-octulosonic-acid transferase
MKPGQAGGIRRAPQPKGKQIACLFGLNLLLILLSPFILLKKLSRILKKGSRHELDWHRFFIPAVQSGVPLASKQGPRIVLFGPAFGELRLVESLTRELLKANPEANIIWCIGDLATIDFAKGAYPGQPIVISPYENI